MSVKLSKEQHKHVLKQFTKTQQNNNEKQKSPELDEKIQKALGLIGN